MARKKFSVREKEAHYKDVMSNKETVEKKAKKATSEANRASYAAGYLRAVNDCRSALVNSKKKK